MSSGENQTLRAEWGIKGGRERLFPTYISTELVSKIQMYIQYVKNDSISTFAALPTR
jgi:hypothetical protein